MMPPPPMSGSYIPGYDMSSGMMYGDPSAGMMGWDPSMMTGF